MKTKTLKSVLILGLFLALLPLPYEYFSILRIYAVIVFGILLLQIPTKNQNLKNWTFIMYIALILLYQPFIRIPLGRTLWNIIDVVAVIWLLVSMNKKK